MTPIDLDDTYTHLAKCMTTLGEEQTPLMLAKLALLAMHRFKDANEAKAWINEACKGI